MVCWLVEKEYVGGTDELPRYAKASAFTATQLRMRTRSRFDRIESQSMENSIHPGRKSISAFTIESLEISVVTGKHSRRRLFTELSDLDRLFGKRLFEREQISKLSRRCFPHSCGRTEITMLLEQSNLEPWLLGDRSCGRFLFASNQAEERSLAGSVTPDDSPAISLRRSERDIPE